VISELIGARIRSSTLRLGEALGRWGLTPNLLTGIGLVLNLVVAAVIASGSLRVGGALLLLASGFDMLDGAVARASGTVTKFGGFLDSTIDRYSESLVYGGVLVYLLGTQDYRLGSLLIIVATAGSLLISYARARAEAAGFRASVGLLARPERVLILAIGLLTGYVIPALWILAIGTHLTVMTRMAHVWRLSRSTEPRAG
jgi:CDP-diacylglycerol---glycerol-3-phosphate 3-phosphatidyltransferase